MRYSVEEATQGFLPLFSKEVIEKLLKRFAPPRKLLPAPKQPLLLTGRKPLLLLKAGNITSMKKAA